MQNVVGFSIRLVFGLPAGNNAMHNRNGMRHDNNDGDDPLCGTDKNSVKPCLVNAGIKSNRIKWTGFTNT